MEFRTSVPARPVSVGFVRRAMQSFTEACGPAKAADLALIFTELVTNSIRHGRLAPDATIDVTMSLDGADVRGTVTDPGRGFDLDRLGPRPHATGGFGLFIVARLVRTWGVENTPRGTTVWFEM